MRLFFSLALRNLWFHPVRSGLVASCIAAVCALMVILTALAGGVRGSLVDSAIALVSGHINVLGYYKIGHSSPLTLIEKQDKLQGLLRTGGFAHARIVARVKAIGKAVSEHKSLQLVLWGIDPRIEAQSFAHLIIAPPGAEGGFAARGTIALFAAQAKALGVQPGDALTVTLPIYRGGQQTLDLKVTAILREQGVLSRFHALLNADDLREVSQIAPAATSQIMIFLPDGQTADTSRLADLLTQNGYRLLDVDPSASTWAKLETAASEPFVGQRLEVDTWRDEIAPVAWIVDIFTSFSWLMTVVLMTLVILGLSHTQTMAILEWTDPSPNGVDVLSRSVAFGECGYPGRLCARRDRRMAFGYGSDPDHDRYAPTVSDERPAGLSRGTRCPGKSARAHRPDGDRGRVAPRLAGWKIARGLFLTGIQPP